MSKTPNQDLYNKLKASSKSNADKILQLYFDATWHIVKKYSKEQEVHDMQFLATADVQQTWHGFEDFMKQHSRKTLASLHLSIFQFAAPSEAKMSHDSLATIIWNYRLMHAVDHTTPQPTVAGTVVNPLQRQSSIGGREYRIITPSPDAKPFTSPAGLACLKIIKDTIAESGFCTEAELKVAVAARAIEITPKTDSAWRFLQFYRPLLIEAELITYKK